MASLVLPPVRWPDGWRWPRVHQRMLYIGVGSAVALVLGVLFRSLPVILVSALISFVCLALWYESREKYRTSQLVNAVTLTEALAAPPDSWVHFFRERRRSIGVLVLMFLIGAVFSCVGVLTWIIQPADSVVVVRTVGTAAGLLGVLFIATGWRGLVGRKRLGSFGERPLGFALGESALMLVTVTGVAYVPWTDILAVEATQADRDSKDDDHPGVMWLNLTVRRADGSSTPVMLAPMTSEVHPWVTYAAIAMAAANPEFRARLGTSRAQAELDAWHAYATGSRNASR